MKVKAKKIWATVGVAFTSEDLGKVVEVDDHRGQLAITAGVAERVGDDVEADRVIGRESLRRPAGTAEAKPAEAKPSEADATSGKAAKK